MKNALNRFVPKGFKAFAGSEAVIKNEKRTLINEVISNNDQKLFNSLSDVIDKLNIQDGMTLSFHHHLRNGDHVLNMVLAEVKKRNIKNLTLAPSSIFPVHTPLVPLIEDQTVTKIFTNYVNGPVAKAISQGKLVTYYYANSWWSCKTIEAGEVRIDVAFVATNG